LECFVLNLDSSSVRVGPGIEDLFFRRPGRALWILENGSMHEAIDWELLAKYVSGNCSEAERAAVETWVNADPAHRQLLEELRETWMLMGQAQRPVLVEAAWQRVQAQLTTALSRPPHPMRRHRPMGWGARVLAVLIVALGLALAYAEFWPSQKGSPSEEIELVRVFTTQRGQRATIQLLDGTRIFLAPESRLEVAATYGRAGREVTLSGEAFFEVASDSLHPFVVQTSRLAVRVLGTAFGVRAYANENQAYVAVRQGKVQVQSDRVPATLAVFLEAGQVARLVGQGQLRVERMASLDVYLSWAEGRLVFVRTPLREVVQVLERWYDLEIELSDPALGERQLTATFEEASAYQVLQIIAATMNLETVRDAHHPRRILWRPASNL
jgi:transmembrane sensor